MKYPMKKFAILMIALLACVAMSAGEVTEEQALEKARKFMQDKSFKQKNLRRAMPKNAENSAYYVFNAEGNDGFVIVSGDDRTEAILGYCDSGSFDISNMPENVKSWMDYYEQSIRSLDDQQVQNAQEKVYYAAIEPLIRTKWNQGAPYNLLCPMDGKERSVTGCVATALAQVMYYHRWPQDATGAIPAYTTSEKEFFMNELAPTVFKWDKMTETYNYEDTGEAADAVAELMLYCGQINEMDYTSGGSGAYLHLSNLVTLFGYSNNMRSVDRSDYTTVDWERMAYEELSLGRPIMYSGFSPTSGHEFVCDGYDGNGLFHINWGWGGGSDGYFVLSVANPEGKGIGGGEGSDGYAKWQSMILGFAPPSAGEVVYPQLFSYIEELKVFDYIRASATEDFRSVSLPGYIFAHYNVLPANNIDVEVGWALYKDGEFIKTLGYGGGTIGTEEWNYVNNGLMVDFGANLSEGKYQLYQVYRFPGSSEWLLCETGLRNGFVAEISETSLTLRPVDADNVVLTLNSVSYSDMEKGAPAYVTLNMTNAGESLSQSLYYWIQTNGSWGEPVAQTTAYIDPGQTASVVLSFTPEVAGSLNTKLTSDEEGNNVIATGVVEISDVKEFVFDGITYICAVNAKKARVGEQPSGASIPEVLTIPSNITMDGVVYQVKSIDDYAFWNKNEIKELIISEGIETIGWCAFRYCFGMNKLTLPSTLTKIDDYAFGNCSALASVTVSLQNPVEINDNVFGIIGSEGTVMPSSATLYVPIGTTSKYQATQGWSIFQAIYEGELKETTIDAVRYSYVTGSKVATLLKGNPNSSLLTIPASITIDGTSYAVKAISANAFWNYNSLKEVVVSEGIETIGQFAFRYCFGLKKLTLPSTLTKIDECAFGNCTAMTSVTVHLQDPFEIENNVFEIYNSGTSETTPPSATLYVPNGTSSKYCSTAGWSIFQKIQELSPTGIENVNNDMSADVFDLRGNKVRSKATSLEGLPKGIYIINKRKVAVQ